ncbi:MAG: protein kinase [Pyrinomonadaceae bacterium]
MTPERWRQIEDVLQSALDRPLAERAAFLDEACAGDEVLRSEATTLVRAYDEAGAFLEQPAIAQDARVLFGDQVDVETGRVVGSYTIVERLGAGGMGEVYLAQDARLNRLVALKVLPAYFVADDARLRRFQREARAVSALNHPNILTIHEVGEADDVRFIATEFIEGQTLRELIAEQDLPLEEILDIAIQIASGLTAAHAAGIVHRDIKPENIMRRTDGIVKILDFGIAKLTEQSAPEYPDEVTTIINGQTEAGVVMGTVGYMSPEQARGLKVDERTDIWSLGCVLYEMLARRAPFASATRMDTLVAILERDPPPVEFMKDASAASQQLQNLVRKTLCKERSERPQTATALLADLNAVRRQLDFVETFAAPHTARHLSRYSLFAALIIVALVMIAVTGAFLYKRSLAPHNADAINAHGALLTNPTTTKLYAQMNDAEKLAFIGEQEQRISAMMGDHPVHLNDEALHVIRKYVDYYAARRGSVWNEPGREDLRVVYARAVPYVSLIAREFAARKVPAIVGIYLPMIESEYKACFENSIGAKGLFQFLPQTAKRYGVAHEEMCDVKKMTPAAAHYIADRMAELGDDSQSMTLVLLSYNRGEEGVRSALRELRNTANYERNFWTLYANRDKLDAAFRTEAGYVPNFFAAAIIGENPQTFELQTPPLSTLANAVASAKP